MSQTARCQGDPSVRKRPGGPALPVGAPESSKKKIDVNSIALPCALELNSSDQRHRLVNVNEVMHNKVALRWARRSKRWSFRRRAGISIFGFGPVSSSVRA